MLRLSASRDWLESRNATTDQIRWRFFAGSPAETGRKLASRMIAKERRRGRIRERGTVLLNETGRSEKVFGKPCPECLLAHEVAVTEAELWLGSFARRGPRAGDATADALLMRREMRFFVEIDNQTETGRQLRQKFQRYAGVTDMVLVVCRTKSRLRTILRNAEAVADIAMFTRFRWLRATFVKRIWLDRFGERGTL